MTKKDVTLSVAKSLIYAKEVGSKYNVRYYTKEDELIKDKDVQVVYIATPVNLHHGQTIKAANAGKHILCEKPLALTLKECEEMIKICKNNKIKLGLGFMMRFHAHHKKAKEMIKSGLLGRLVLGRAQLSCWYPEIKGAWRQDYVFFFFCSKYCFLPSRKM